MSPAEFPRGISIGGVIPRPSASFTPHRSSAIDRGSVRYAEAGADRARLEAALHSAADDREFRLGHYQVSLVRTGADYDAALGEFHAAVIAGAKTGFLAIFAENAQCRSVAEELRVVAAVLRDAGLTDDPLGLIEGQTLSLPMPLACPVTGQETIYEFRAVALCRNAANPHDPLYDPWLAAPFTAVRITSEALAFARFVDAEALRTFGRPVYRMAHDRGAVETLFDRCVVAWQSLAAATIMKLSGTAVDPARAAHLSEDRAHWYAAHNEAAFAERTKQAFRHEMPVLYARRLAVKWSANLFDAKPYAPSRAGVRVVARF